MFWSQSPKPSTEEPKPTGPRVNVDPVANEIFENPWYPLNGPPRNQEEQELLEKTIKEEQQRIHSELTEKYRDTNRARSALQKDARRNCVDLELEWKQCLTSFNFERFLSMCNSHHEKFQECIRIQERNMERLQYLAHFQVDRSKLESIVDKADQMYLDEMKTRQSL
jgi:hypothetical protein